MHSPDDGTTNQIRILVVEDVDFNLEILTTMLAERGWRTVGAKSGEEALARLSSQPDFQLILMDIGLPGMDGIETTRKIKATAGTDRIPVLALTAEPAGERERFLAAGFDGYVEKNFDPEALYAAVEKKLTLNRTGRPPANALPKEMAVPAVLNLAVLMGTYGDEETVRIIAKAFFSDTGKQIRRLAEAMSRTDSAAVLACCHSIKGSATIFTADALAALAEKLTLLIRAGKKTEAFTLHPEIQEAYNALRRLTEQKLKLRLDG
ncbi:Hpt domain-containing response regulator [Thiovibrio sp. JS02]